MTHVICFFSAWVLTDWNHKTLIAVFVPGARLLLEIRFKLQSQQFLDRSIAVALSAVSKLVGAVSDDWGVVLLDFVFIGHLQT